MAKRLLSTWDAWISLEREKRKGYIEGSWGVEQEGSDMEADDLEGESEGREVWNWGAFGRLCGNLVQWKLDRIHEGNTNEDS